MDMFILGGGGGIKVQHLLLVVYGVSMQIVVFYTLLRAAYKKATYKIMEQK